MGKKIPMWQCLVVLLFCLIVLCYALNIFGQLFGEAFECGYGEVHIPLIISAIFAAAVAVANGYKWAFLEAGIMASINRSMQACIILMIVGLLIGSWIAAGVVPAMIYYGLMILQPSIFLLAACVLASIVSLATGSSWTTAGTIGIALIGVGNGLGMPIAMTAGAVVSGAYFGDKMSPLSDTTNLAPAMAGSNLFDHIKHMVYTTGPALIISLVIYAILGIQGDSSSYDPAVVTDMQNEIASNFNINPLLLIPPVLVIVIVALKIPALPGLIAGVLLGCIFGSIFQGVALADWFSLVHYGFDYAGTFYAEVGVTEGTVAYDMNDLLTRGGMDGMLWTINLIICAMTFGGIMDASGMLATLAGSLLKIAKSNGLLVVVTSVACVFVNVVSADQYLSLVLPGRMFKEAYEDRRLAPKNLSRVLEDVGTITSNLVPWNTCGVTMRTFLGTPQWGTNGYAPYAFLCWLTPIITNIYAFTGITMTKMTEEEYQAILVQREKEKEEANQALEA